MPLNRAAIGVERTVERAWSERDALLYAIAVGSGQEDPSVELAFTTENTNGVPQQVLPTFAVLLQVLPTLLLSPTDEPLPPSEMPGFVHGEQAVTLHRLLPPAGRATATGVIREIWDKGSGALVDCVSEVRDAATGELLATLENGTFARGDGGFGGPRGESPSWKRPAREPDVVRRFPTSRGQALLYRLTGDRFPLHSDPAFARAAGFEGPILHGLCTYGFTGRALLRAVGDGEAHRFGSMRCRFTRPVYPGQELEVAIWRTGDGALFQTLAGGAVVADHGTFTLAA